MFRFLSTTILILALTGCAGEAEKAAQPLPTSPSEIESKPENRQEVPEMITVRGTVRYKTLEGGFWGLDGDDGKKYMPSGLDKALRVDGMVIEVEGIIEEDVVTFQQYGKTLKIKQSRLIDDSNAKALNLF